MKGLLDKHTNPMLRFKGNKVITVHNIVTE